MIWLLIVVMVTVVAGGTRAAVRPAGVEINHIVLFSFGIGFYWVLPVVAGLIRIFSDEPGLAVWYGTWDAAARSGNFAGFLALTLVTYCAFIAGDRAGSRLRLAQPSRERELTRDPRLLSLFLPFALAITLLYAWILRGQLFDGYRFINTPGIGARGTLSACSLLLLVLCLIRAAETERWPRAHGGRYGWLFDPFLIAYVISAVLVLSLGGRLYVVSAVITAVVYHTVYRRPLPVARAAIVVLVAMTLAGIAGTLRLGAAPSPLGVLINLVSEPLFTGFSLLHFIAQDNVPWVAVPRFLLSDFLNLVPTVLLPTKSQYLLNPSDLGYSIFSPLGALNSYVSLMINFGRLGTPFVIFLLGALLALLKRRRTALARVMYAMLAGWIPFTFFRDPFSISVVKNMFEFSVLLPTLIIWSMHVMTVIAPRRAVLVRAVSSGEP